MFQKTPPMGWNSWNTFGEDINEKVVLTMADAMVEKGYLEKGYEYLVIDDCWSLRERGSDGRLQADPKKFPHGMKYVADYVHEKGLKFGMYSCSGTLTCAGYPSSYDHEYIDAETFASWGVDFLKYDYCYHPKTVPGRVLYHRMANALNNCGRDILFSACSWGVDETAKWIKETGASMWRSTGDIFDSWESIKKLTYTQLEILPYAGVGCFNDMDMLVVGMHGKGNVGLGGCSSLQYRTHFSIWALMGSPLMIGSDIRSMPDEDLETLQNEEMITINQDPSCRQLAALTSFGWKPEDLLVLFRPLTDGDLAIGLFNLSDEARHMGFVLDEMGIPVSSGKTLLLHEVWSKQDIPVINETYTEKVEAYGCRVFRAKIVDK